MRGVGDGEDRGRGENFMKMIKGALLERAPYPMLILLGEEGEWDDDVGIIWNEFAIKVCKSQE